MARRLISLRLDPALIEAAREAARRERRSLGNLVEVALERYIGRPRGGVRPMARWVRATDGAYEARFGPYRLEVWYDTQGAQEDRGWAWRVTGPDGTDESGPGDSLEDAQAQAEAALPPPERRAYRAAVYEGPDGAEVVLTTPEDADLPDADLREAAVEEAYDAGLIGDEPHQVTEEALRQRLRIEVWVPR